MKKVFFLLLAIVCLSYSGFAQMKKLLPTNPSGDRYKFGTSVATDGTYIVVGATDDDQITNNNGAVYVFSNQAGNWVQTAKLLPNTGNQFSEFGTSVAILGNYIAIGSTNVVEGGTVFIFKRNGNNWNFLTSVRPQANESTFGSTVTMTDKYLAVSAKNENRGSSNIQAGAVYMYDRSGDNFTFVEKLISPAPVTNGLFGTSISLNGERLIVGSPGDGNGSNGAGGPGGAYVFTRNGGSWQQEVKLTGNDIEGGDQYGTSVFLTNTQAIVGAIWDKDKGAESGSAYIFTRNNTTWTQTAKLVAWDGDAGDNFGNGVALSGDYAIASAPTNEQGGSFSGSIYVFRRQGNNYVQVKRYESTDPNANEGFGRALNASASGLAVIGASGDNQNGDFTGAAFALDVAVSSNQELEIYNSGLSIFPNPAIEKINVNWVAPQGKSLPDTMPFRIMDAAGVMLLNGRIAPQNSVIELGDLPKGTYILELEADQIRFGKPFVKD